MDAVSVYPVGADGPEPSCFFGREARDGDLPRAVWLGWLPLSLVDFAGPGIAQVCDAWLTAPSGGSGASRPPVPGDVVTVDDAATELAARRGGSGRLVDGGRGGHAAWRGLLGGPGAPVVSEEVTHAYEVASAR